MTDFDNGLTLYFTVTNMKRNKVSTSKCPDVGDVLK
jgi:hypothetical protein